MEIQEGAITPKDDDTLWDDSPDTGAPNCKCSRCWARIKEGETAIRVWTTNDKGEMDELSKEYRYCELCTTGKEYFECEDFEVTGYKCRIQCAKCVKSFIKLLYINDTYDERLQAFYDEYKVILPERERWYSIRRVELVKGDQYILFLNEIQNEHILKNKKVLGEPGFHYSRFTRVEDSQGVLDWETVDKIYKSQL